MHIIPIESSLGDGRDGKGDGRNGKGDGSTINNNMQSHQSTYLLLSEISLNDFSMTIFGAPCILPLMLMPLIVSAQ